MTEIEGIITWLLVCSFVHLSPAANTFSPWLYLLIQVKKFQYGTGLCTKAQKSSGIVVDRDEHIHTHVAKKDINTFECANIVSWVFVLKYLYLYPIPVYIYIHLYLYQSIYSYIVNVVSVCVSVFVCVFTYRIYILYMYVCACVCVCVWACKYVCIHISNMYVYTS